MKLGTGLLTMVVGTAFVSLMSCGHAAATPSTSTDGTTTTSPVTAPATSPTKPPTSSTTSPSLPDPKLGMTVEQAYAAIPHRRTVADLTAAKLDAADSAYLAQAFAVADQGVLVRVVALRDARAGTVATTPALPAMDALVAYAKGIKPPANLEAYHAALLSALQDQRSFFVQWKQEGATFAGATALPRDVHVTAASASLIRAYGELMRLYPTLSPDNKHAFYDYHCALDFL